MRKISLIVSLLFSLLFVQCSDEKSNPSTQNGAAAGGVFYGGIIRANESESPKSLMPLAINEIGSYHIASQVFEGLVKYNQSDLTILPAIARSWDISPDVMEYTFHLRSNVRYHDNPCFKDSIGRYVTAADVKFCFENLCSKSIYNTQFDVTFKDRVEGANQFFAESKSGLVRNFSGITVVDDSTLKIRLVQPDANFLNILSMPGCYIYPKEAYFKYGEDLNFNCIWLF